MAAYNFNEGSGTIVNDASGNGNNGTISGATWTTSGKYGNALSFNGSNSGVTVPDSASLHLTTSLTLEAWVYPTTVSSAWRDVIEKGNDNYYLEATAQFAGGVPADGGTWAEPPVYGASILPVNVWSHLASTYDGSTLRLYLNGAQVASKSVSGLIGVTTDALTFGSDPFYGQYLSGRIDDIRIYRCGTLVRGDDAIGLAQGHIAHAECVLHRWVQGRSGGPATPPSLAHDRPGGPRAS